MEFYWKNGQRFGKLIEISHPSQKIIRIKNIKSFDIDFNQTSICASSALNPDFACEPSQRGLFADELHLQRAATRSPSTLTIQGPSFIASIVIFDMIFHSLRELKAMQNNQKLPFAKIYSLYPLNFTR